jgi:uncharacterized membrane protein
MAWVLLVATTGAGAVVVVAWLGMTGKLPRNRIAGIRTPYTLSSDERWLATHRAGGPFLVLGAVAAFAIGLALLPFALAGELGDAFVAAGLSAMAVLVVASALAAWIFGTRSARGLVG